MHWAEAQLVASRAFVIIVGVIVTGVGVVAIRRWWGLARRVGGGRDLRTVFGCRHDGGLRQLVGVVAGHVSRWHGAGARLSHDGVVVVVLRVAKDGGEPRVRDHSCGHVRRWVWEPRDGRDGGHSDLSAAEHTQEHTVTHMVTLASPRSANRDYSQELWETSRLRVADSAQYYGKKIGGLFANRHRSI
ncbi:hypothetical protein EDB83DRAFT_2322868 [Lactarius deliciosus]|nr:hypothetical protein EDB83DRAFT_2322868 [Lactarius deliciosus]